MASDNSNNVDIFANLKNRLVGVDQKTAKLPPEERTDFATDFECLTPAEYEIVRDDLIRYIRESRQESQELKPGRIQAIFQGAEKGKSVYADCPETAPAPVPTPAPVNNQPKPEGKKVPAKEVAAPTRVPTTREREINEMRQLLVSEDFRRYVEILNRPGIRRLLDLKKRYPEEYRSLRGATATTKEVRK